jgi:hypothetical protein
LTNYSLKQVVEFQNFDIFFFSLKDTT